MRNVKNEKARAFGLFLHYTLHIPHYTILRPLPQQGAQVGFDASRKGGKMVATLKGGDNPTWTAGVGNLKDQLGELSVSSFSDLEASQRVVLMRIEACGDQHQLWLERKRPRKQLVAKSADELSIAAS